MNIAGVVQKSTTLSKSRSCVICRNRKVRCDKRVPCSNCRRAGIPNACILPPAETQPRWARNLQEKVVKSDGSQTDHADLDAPSKARPVKQVADKLKDIESLIQNLRNELEQGQHGKALAKPDRLDDNPVSSRQTEPPTADLNSTQKQFGRMVIEDNAKQRYISNGFWSRIDDELNELHSRTAELSDDDSESRPEEASFENTPNSHTTRTSHSSPYSAYIGEVLNTDEDELVYAHPSLTHRSHLLDIFESSVNFYLRVVHMPTVLNLNSNIEKASLTASEHALFFALYYAAVTTLEEEDAMSAFGLSKWALRKQFRGCLEAALNKANYLESPNLTSLQAFAVFVLLLRRHDSPSYVYMVTGLAIRMAMYLGLHRDGAQFKDMKPYEIEMRRRTWWLICHLDLRAAEDQAMDVTITDKTGDTKVPLNYNEFDLESDSEALPLNRNGLTDSSFVRIAAGLTVVMRRMTVLSAEQKTNAFDEQNKLLQQINAQFEQEYLQFEAEPDNILFWVMTSIARLVTAKMTLIVFLPVLFSPPEARVSDNIRIRLIVAAIEVAEFNHELNDNQQARQWRWIYQTHTHWYSIVYLLIVTAQCPWSPIVERAWQALQSPWLIPSRARTNEHSKIWVPLWKLMSRARRHRETEIVRLRANPDAARQLEKEDERIPSPASFGQHSRSSTKADFVSSWRHLIDFGIRRDESAFNNHAEVIEQGSAPQNQTAPHPQEVYLANLDVSDGVFEHDSQNANSTTSLREPQSFSHHSPSQATAYADDRLIGPSTTHWLWADNETGSVQDTDWSNFNMTMEFDWHDWIASAKEIA